MIEKYKERVTRAKTYNAENLTKKFDKQKKYTERVSRAKTRNLLKIQDDIENNYQVESDESDVHEEFIEEINNINIDGYPPNNFIEKSIAYVVQRNFKCHVLFK